ncbi:MAG TPA: endo-1,3-alpha-glucanase family glycosylhydrolase [Chloroflexota bacterium]|nr:endo-1,3-alpha-glucanase family glycosylhydrolase [Chloroflexota bacterium]
MRRGWIRYVWAVTLVISALLSAIPTPTGAAAGPPVLAMYYAWYDGNSWGPGRMSDYPPAPYQSADRSTIERQVTQAQGAGIDGFELDWYGPNNPTDSNLATLLSVAQGHGFKATIDFDLTSPFIHNPGDTTNFLNYAKRYFANPAWLKLNGKPVVVFYHTRAYSVATWSAIRAQVDPGHSAVWIGEGDDFSYLNVFDGIHPYSIAWSGNPAGQLQSYASRARSYPGKLWMATVMPGYDDTHLGRAGAFAVNRQGGAYYASVWQGAIASRPDLISITSWNEWPEGTQIEPSKSYGNLYLQLTQQWSARYKSGGGGGTSDSSTGGRAFYTEAGQGQGGYAISDDAGVAFFDAFQSLGGVGALGYPSSQRFVKDGFTYQATQGALLQWHPELKRAVLANTFDWFSDAGKDDWLLQNDGIPKPIRDDGSNGDWAKARATRLSWLTDPAIRAKYLSVGSEDQAIQLYGLPESRPEQHGPFVVQRFQRIAFQHWVTGVPNMPPVGSVVRILGGDLLKQAGLIPPSAAQPSAR